VLAEIGIMQLKVFSCNYVRMLPMDIHHLRVFASVFKDKSFSKASKKLRLTQPTVSAHIRSLEEEYNCKLFDRLGRTIIPTKEAEVLYKYAIEIIEKTDAIKEVVGRFKNKITGKLIIGASTIPGTYLLPLIMTTFQKKYPSVSFQILIADSKKIVESLSKHELLMGIVGAKLGNDKINYVPFLDDELIVVSSPSLMKSNRIVLKELIKFPMIMREEGSGTRTMTEQILSEKGITHHNISIAGVFGSTDAVKQAVKAGLGVSILSRLSVSDELKYKTLKEIKITDVSMKRKFYIITHKRRTLPPSYHIFLNYVKADVKTR
jgi:DNA-binding transcriptional LysR family regulator